MARNDGIDRTFARNQDLPTLDDVAKVQEHNEREKDSYSNQDIDTTQTYRNIHFKAPTGSYAAMFDQMIADGMISTRGLKADAVKYGELIFDVNSAYFHNHHHSVICETVTLVCGRVAIFTVSLASPPNRKVDGVLLRTVLHGRNPE